MTTFTHVISAKTRERLSDEATIASAEQYPTGSSNAANLAFDMKLNTKSRTDKNYWPWLKVKLDKKYCIHQVVWYLSNGDRYQTWTCSFSDCSTCRGSSCSLYSLMVSSEGSSKNCVYTDTVKLRGNYNGRLEVYELAVIQKLGETIYWEMLVNY